MKYIFENKLDEFDFHDSFVKIKDRNGRGISLYIDNMMIRRNSELNIDRDYDMELIRAVITIKNVTLLNINSDKLTGKYENGVYEGITDEGKKAVSKEDFLSILIKGVTVTDVVAEQKTVWIHFDPEDSRVGFSVNLSYDNITIEWDSSSEIA